MRLDRIPTEWGEGGFTGNGLLGFMAYAPDGHALAWELGRTDVTERRPGGDVDCDAFRVPIGRLVLQGPEGQGAEGEGWLHLDPRLAEVRGAVGPVGYWSVTHAVRDVVLIDLTGSATLGFQPGYSMPLSLGYGRAISKELMNPPPVVSYEHGRLRCIQAASLGRSYATVVDDWGGGRYAVAIGWGTDPLQEALAELESARAEGWDRLVETHRGWWEEYHSASTATLPDARYQGYYDLQIYKLACATRAHRPAMDLLGPWTLATVWAATWWNLNIQLCYPPVCAANHVELGDSFLGLLRDATPNFVANAAPWEDAAIVGRATDRDGVGTWDGEWCNLPWACHVAWRLWRCTMDPATLRDDVLPLLRSCMNYYRHLLEEGADGRLHLPSGISPEYHEEAADTSINLALIRWGAGVLAEAGDEGWQEVLERLAPYHRNEDGLMIGTDVALTRSHRHFSHLLAIYPLGLLSPDLPEERALIERSLAHWAGLDEEFVGYSYAVAASMYAILGKGDRALSMLNRGFERFGTPNTMYLEHGWGAPTLETPLAVLSALQEMSLQSQGGTIRVFPAVPTAWADVSFTTWRAEGAFLVSAERVEGHTRHIFIESLAGSPCRVRTGMADPVVEVEGVVVGCEHDGPDLLIPLAAGQKASVKDRSTHLSP